MHILPAAQLASFASDFVSNLLPGTKNDADFVEAFRLADEEAQRSSHTDSRDLGVLQSTDSTTPQDTESQLYTPLEKAPIAPHSTNGVLYQVDEVGFTQKELSSLRDELLKEGLSPDSLTAIEQLASHPHGATLGQLLTLMNGSLLQAASLSDSDKESLQHFAGKLDPGGTLGKDLVDLLESGRKKDAWDLLKSSLANLNPRDFNVLGADDAALMCRAFGISQQASFAVLKPFANAQGMLLTPDTFTALMVPAEEEILNRSRQDSKLGQALAKHLQPLIDAARQRTENERKAAQGGDRRTKQSEILIRDKAMTKFHANIAGPEQDEAGQPSLTGAKTAVQGAAAASVAKTALAQEDALRLQDRLQAAATAKTPEDNADPKKSPAVQDPLGRGDMDEWQKNRSRGEQGMSGNGDKNQDTLRDSRALLARLDLRDNAPSTGMPPVAAFTLPMQPQENSAGQISNPAPLIRQALQQVEQGTLSKLASGGQRIELQLAPSELGSVTLILTSAKSGEISATIRSEKTETAELVARHLDIIRVSLEEQGLKVDKLEVQNQLLNNQDTWQGMEQHNAMREEQERREQLDRLRRLGRQGEQQDLRAQEMQSHEYAAEISAQGLHLVA